MDLPHFLIIGAMKCATSTLHEQLDHQPGIFMSEPKEPCFFSNDEIHARGIGWYRSLFNPAPPHALCGESSTHYTKLPTYPRTLDRLKQHLRPDVKLIYVMRHPIDRLISQYIHEWTERRITEPIDRALDRHPELIDYSRYTMQLEPFLAAYGAEQVLPIFFDHLRSDPQAVLERVCRFIGYTGEPRWREESERTNASAERMRKSPLRDAIVYMPGLKQARERLIPRSVRDRVKGWWRMSGRPELGDASMRRLCEIFDEDLHVLGGWLGVELNCDNFRAVTGSEPLNWNPTTVHPS